MYAPSYGYAPGNASAPFTPNGVSPGAQPHNPHQQQPSQQQPQHMMYNQQQYAGAGGQQSPYGSTANGMGGNAGAMGMMQNNGMAHMAGGHVPSYQTPYSGSPYGGTIPTSAAGNLPPNFMPPTSNASAFQMNPNMNIQHQVQRMQPPPTSSTPQPGPRAAPFAGGQQNTPPPSQPQFSTSQNAAHLQATSNNQQTQVVTPQTPTFPSGTQNAAGSNLATPLSPGSEQREKERVTLLLEINNKLLQEVMRLQAAHNETKKEESAPNSASTDGPDKEKEKVSKPPASRDYFECMRRLQGNLAYLAAIADRSHKPSSQIPAHPQIMSAPPLTPKSSQPKSPSTALSSDGTKKEGPEDKKHSPEDAEEDRGELIKDLYKRLQALFPGVDPKKEPPMPGVPTAAQRAQMQAAQKQQGQQGGQVGGTGNEQQKMQNELLRQKMMQAQQNHNQNAAQQGQAGGR